MDTNLSSCDAFCFYSEFVTVLGVCHGVLSFHGQIEEIYMFLTQLEEEPAAAL